MSEAFVFDAIRTPRGKGKKDGSLYEVKPVNLLAGLLTELQRRNDFDTAQVDDVVMGIVSPVGEQGSVLPKVAALKAGWDFQCAGVQLNRFCASGLEAVNMAAQKVRSGWEDLVVAGGVESMSRVPIGSDGGAWAHGPGDQQRHAVRAAGHRRRPDRHAGRLQPRRRGRLRAGIAEARHGRARRGLLRPLGGAGERLRWARPSWTRTSSSSRAPRWKAWPRSSRPSSRWAPWASTPWRCSVTRRWSASTTCTTPATRRASWTARRRC